MNDRPALHLIPGLRKGGVLTEPVEPPGINEDDLLGLKPWTEKCSSQECRREARWHLTWCPGTDHQGGGYACDEHLEPMHRSTLEDVACKPHRHDEPRTRPPVRGA